MAIQLGSAYGKVSIDSSGVASGANNAVKSMGSIETAAKKLGMTLQNVGKAMTVAVTVPLALMAKQAVMAASDFTETKNKVVVVFKDMTDAVMKWSEGSATSMHLSQQQALEAASTFGNLFIAMKIGTKESADMSMALVQLAADLGSMNNIDPSLVLVKLKSGIVGETEAVRDLGIDLRATTVEAKAMEMGFVKVNGVFSQSSLIAARYAIIMEQTKVAQGDVARTGKEFAGQLVEFKAHWGDTLRILGDNLLPIVKQILTQLNKWLIWFNNADPKTQKFIATLLLFAFVIGPLLFLLGKALPFAFSGATKSMNPFSGGIFGLIGTIIKFIGVAATIIRVLTFLGISTGAAGTFITGLATAIAGVGATIFSAIIAPLLLLIATIALVVLVWKNWDKLGVTISQLGFIIKTVFSNMFKNITVTIGQLMFIVKHYITQAMAGIGTAIDWVGKKWDALVLKFKSLKLPAALTPGSPTPFEMGLRGIANAMDMVSNKNIPNLQASLARPVQNNSSSQQQNITMQFANGLTTRQAENMIAQNNELLLKRLNRAMGGT